METLLRIFQMLALIPRDPLFITTTELHEKLAALDFQVDLRTVERNMAGLAGILPLVANEDVRPTRWSWDAETPTLAEGGLDPVLALALVLVDTYFSVVLPPALRDALAPLVRAVRTVLEARAGTAPAELAKRFRLVSKGPAAIPPVVRPEVLAAVTRAVAERRKLEAVYHPEGDGPREYLLDPLGFVLRGTSLYLVAWKPGREERQFLLHRFDSARLLREKAEPDDDFDLDKYLASGKVGYALSDTPIELVARFTTRAARAVAEAPLSSDQDLEILPDGEVRVRATVNHTRELEAWLLGFGAAALVEGSPEFAKAIIEIVRAMARRYGLLP